MTSKSLSERRLVRPSIPLVPGRMPLSPLDQYMVRIIMPIMCIFQVEEPSSRSGIIRDLQTGLSHAIDELAMLAALVIPDSEEQNSIQLEWGDDAGVWFHTRELADVSYDEFAAHGFPASRLPPDDFVPEPREHTERSPVLTVQATLIRGGLVLTINAHHAVMDAQGLGTFAAVWSKHVAAAARGLILDDEGRIREEALDASSIFGPKMERPLRDFQPNSSSCAEQSGYEDMQAKILRTALSGDHNELARLVRVSLWSMSQDQLDEFGRATTPLTAGSSRAVTINAALSALLWKHVSRARDLCGKQVSSSSLFTSVNARRRMDPPLATEYPGNAIVLSRTTLAAEELDAAHPESLHEIAEAIADSVEWWTADEIWSLTGAIQACDDVENAMLPPLGYDLMVTSPSRLADMLRSSQWGAELGSVKALRWAFPALMDGFVIILPAMNGGVEVMLWTTPETSERLEADAEWGRWMTRLGC